MSSVFTHINRRWLGNLEYLLIAISVLGFIASFRENQTHIFSTLTPLFLFLSLHANISKQKQFYESLQQQDRVFQLEQLVLSRDASLADIQASLSEFDKLYQEFSQIQQRLSIIENFFKPYKLDLHSINLQQLLNGLEVNIKKAERQYNQGKILESQLKLQEQLAQIEEQLSHQSDNFLTASAPASDYLQDEIHVINQQLQDLSTQVASYSEIQTESKDKQLQIDEKFRKLERQFNNLPFVEFLNRIAQLEELNEQVKTSLIESKRMTKSLKGEVESLGQKLQCIIATASNAQTENSDRQSSLELQASYKQNLEMTQRLAKEVSSLRKQTQSILSSLSARITQLRIEIDNQQRHSEKPSAKISANTDDLATWAGEIGDRLQQK
jgi:chromosome segregation ATPase